MAKKYLDENGLLYFWQKIKNTFALKSHTHTKSQITDFPSIPGATSTSPKMNGSAAVGTETTYARGDHVHPVDSSRAPNNHASTATTYGTGNASNYGHVKLSDATNGTATVTGGTAATPKAVSDALTAAKNYADGLDTGVSDVKVDGTSVVSSGVANVDLSGKVPTSRTVNSKALSADITLTASDVGAAASSHAHGNITSAGALQTTDISIANGDKLVVTDASNSNKVARTSVSFDGSTATKALTQKGTFETFNNYSHPSYTTASAAAVKVGRDATGHVVIGSALAKGDVGLGNVDNTSDANKPISTATQSALDNKVDKVTGKGLSTNDYTNTDKETVQAFYDEGLIYLGYSDGMLEVNGYGNAGNSMNLLTSSVKGSANGVCPLDASSKIDTTYLPSYVDDVIEANVNPDRSGANWLVTGTTGGGTSITPDKGKIYVVIGSVDDTGAQGVADDYVDNQYRWSGSQYVKLADGGVSSITNAEIDTIVAA